MSTQVDVIYFARPERSNQCLFVTNLPSQLTTEDLWSSLQSSFSKFGLVYKIDIPEKGDQKYAFIKFYSVYACEQAQHSLNRHLLLAGQPLRVIASRGRDLSSIPTLHISDCHTLANHYFGFNGWNTTIRSLRLGPHNVCMCEVVLCVREWGVESVGRANVNLEQEGVQSVGALQKQAVNRACEEAFSRLVLAVVQPGDRLASVQYLGTPSNVECRRVSSAMQQ